MTETPLDVGFESITDKATRNNISEWLSGSFDEKTKQEVRSLIKDHSNDAVDAFYKKLTFGTGGIRGLMGVGSNRVNVYTIKMATQGLANYLKLQNKSSEKLSVLIGYDSRHGSKEFAEEAAKVFAGNQIKVYLFKEIRPTPLVSFGCRYKKCNAAVMITASHNPPEYNGYKVYWSDGAQVLPPHDAGIIEQFEKIKDNSEVLSTTTLDHPLIEWVDTEVDDAYIEDIKTLASYPAENHDFGNTLNILYTSLHGTGITMVPRALAAFGFHSLAFVDPQVIPDGNFPTAHYPNPEEKEALKLGIEKLQNGHYDILIATDPDADRMGVVAMHRGQPYIFTGNQIACLCLEHLCKALSEKGLITDRTAFIKTIVTTELFRAITEHYGASCFDVLTGFKYIAEKIREWESTPNGYQFIFGAEESYGSLVGTFARDKDAVSASALISEAALQAKLENKTLVDKLEDIFEVYGIYSEQLRSVNFPETKSGKEAMQKAMEQMRLSPFTEIDGYHVNYVDDYLKRERLDTITGIKSPLTLPSSDVLVWWLEGGGKLMVRPSGTEPKVKVYCGIIQKEFESIESGERSAKRRGKELLEAVEERLLEVIQKPGSSLKTPRQTNLIVSIVLVHGGSGRTGWVLEGCDAKKMAKLIAKLLLMSLFLKQRAL